MEALATPSLRDPVLSVPEDGRLEPSTPSREEDACEELRAENAWLNEEIVYLHKEIALLSEYDGTSPFGRFLRLPTPRG